MNDNAGFAKTLTAISLLIIAISFGLIEVRHGEVGMGILGTNLTVCITSSVSFAKSILAAIFIMWMIKLLFAIPRVKKQYSDHYCAQPVIKTEGEKLKIKAVDNIKIMLSKANHARDRSIWLHYDDQNTSYIDQFDFFHASCENKPIPYGYIKYTIANDPALQYEEVLTINISDADHRKFRNESARSFEFWRLFFLEFMPVFFGFVAMILLVIYVFHGSNYNGCPPPNPKCAAGTPSSLLGSE